VAEMPPDYPRRLLCNGRAIDPEFSATEQLYFRIPPLQSDEDDLGEILPPAKIRSLPFSVNRGKFSRANDVLYGHSEFGMAMVHVQDIPKNLISETGVEFEFRVEHVPVEDNELDNYAHSEVRAFRDGQEVDHKKISNDVKLAFREIVSRRARILKNPGRLAEV